MVACRGSGEDEHGKDHQDTDDRRLELRVGEALHDGAGYRTGRASLWSVVKNHADLVQVLAQYSEISRLVVMLEGSEGDLYIDGHARSLSALADDLKKANATTRVDEIVFDSCNVIKGVSDIGDLMARLGVRRATGAASYHVWSSVQIPVPRKASAATLESALKSTLPAWDLLRDYLVPGQPSLADLAARGGRPYLYFEFFTRDYGFGSVQLPNIRGAAQLHGVLPRTKLIPKTYRAGDAASAKADLESLAGPIYSVAFEGQSAAPAPPAKRPDRPSQPSTLRDAGSLPSR